MLKDFTPYPWVEEDVFVFGQGKRIADTTEHPDDDMTAEEMEENTAVIRQAPMRYEQVVALTCLGWSVTPIIAYDENGPEGWRWETSEGQVFHTPGGWRESPEWPEALDAAYRAALERRLTDSSISRTATGESVRSALLYVVTQLEQFNPDALRSLGLDVALEQGRGALGITD